MVIPELVNEKSDIVIEEETLTIWIEDIHKVKVIHQFIRYLYN